ncbi:hypothetical protein, partial [Pseudomonas aeruginosa]|uniref:hypothetical protein n=2 Tax=Pseudomonas aeruginosa TaxID=287 RepID=UPI001C8D40A9
LIAALEATAAHGEGINNVKPAALDVVNIFLTNPDLADTLKEDLFTPTASERERLKVNDTAELAMAGISLAQAAKAVLLGNGKALSKLVTGLRKESGEVGAKGTGTASTGAESALNASRLNMQLAAEQVAGSKMPAQITGYSKHGLNQAISRDGVGVAPQAITDAVSNPIKISGQSGGRFVFTGKNAVVVVNSQGKVITTWATSSAGTRAP